MSSVPPPPPPPPGSYPPGSYSTGPTGPQLQNGPGTTSLVTGILSFFLCPLILSIVAIVTGMKGEQLAAQGLANNGETARWGKILGWVSLIVYGAFIVLGMIFGLFGAVFGDN